MAGFKPMFLSAIIVLLLLFCMLTFSGEFIMANNPDSLVLRHKLINSTTSIITQSQNVTAEMNSQLSNLQSDTPSITLVFLIIPTAFSVFKGMISLFFGSIATGINFIVPSLFSSDSSNPFSVIFGFINIILLVSVILAIISAIRTGNSS